MDRKPAHHSAFYEELGENIRNHRKRRKLSQDELAKLVSLTRTSLTNIEKGRQHPPVHTLCDIADQLKVDVSELIPSPAPLQETFDVRMSAVGQTLGENELAFIETAIKGGAPYADTEKQNSSDDTKTSGGQQRHKPSRTPDADR
jgi:transcriptional regulator with XRE-family HTH domain